MSDDCISEKDNILLNKNNFITTLVWSGLLDRAKCGELARAIDLCVVEQEPCEDAISRVDARHLIAETNRKALGCISTKAFKILYDGMDALPPVTPHPKTGYWIDSPNGYFTHCSECGLYGDKGIYKHYGWCPKCGAKMVEQKESEE